MTLVRTAGVGTFVLAAALACAMPAEAGCGKYGGWGMGVTTGIATFMSEKATHDSITKAGAKQTGNVKTTCDTSNVLYVTCTSSARACKP